MGRAEIKSSTLWYRSEEEWRESEETIGITMMDDSVRSVTVVCRVRQGSYFSLFSTLLPSPQSEFSNDKATPSFLALSRRLVVIG